MVQRHSSLDSTLQAQTLTHHVRRRPMFDQTPYHDSKGNGRITSLLRVTLVNGVPRFIGALVDRFYSCVLNYQLVVNLEVCW